MGQVHGATDGHVFGDLYIIGTNCDACVYIRLGYCQSGHRYLSNYLTLLVGAR